MSSSLTPRQGNGSLRTLSSRKNVERSQRLDAFLKDKEDGSNMNWTITDKNREMTASKREEDLEMFMDSVTDKAMAEDAEAAWEKKT